MLKRVVDKEIMTTRQARTKYRTKFFYMLITDVVDTGDNDRGYVIYTADTQKELVQAPRTEYRGMRVASLTGDAAEPYPSWDIVCHAI